MPDFLAQRFLTSQFILFTPQMKILQSLWLPALFLILSIACGKDYPESHRNYIAHGGGQYKGFPVTNSREAVLNSLANGINHIELDLALTKDSVLVATHDWITFKEQTGISPLNYEPLSKAEFLSSKVEGKLTPLSADDIATLMETYPSMVLVTDKISQPQLIESNFGKFRHRVIVECFSLDDYRTLSEKGYKCFISSGVPSWWKGMVKNMAGLFIEYPDAHVTSIEIFSRQKNSGFFKRPYPYEMALYTARDIAEADSLFNLYPDVSFIYVDNIER